METTDEPVTGARQGRRVYRMRARQQAVEETRERILEAAYRLWLAQPFDEVTVEAVAAAAGVSRQTVHRQFGSKDELLIAVTEWRGPREEVLREVAPGDVEAAVRRAVERNEEMGDAVVRMLALEGRIDDVEYVLKQGRAAHRAWIERTFEPYLPRRGASRERAVLALYAATDVTVWKLLRRDFGQSAEDTRVVVGQLVAGVLATSSSAPEES
jgi:AcrR family transcriptional regulator